MTPTQLATLISILEAILTALEGTTATETAIAKAKVELAGFKTSLGS